MLIGKPSKRPSLETVRRIKRALRDGLELPDDATITVTELACLEDGCAPVETVFGLLRPGAPQLQQKLHKAMEAIDAEDLVLVSKAWGFNPALSAFANLAQETQ